MKALVLAAGLGTRFRPETLTTPKPLLRFLGRPILYHLFDHLLRQGATAFVVNTHHLADQLESAVGTSYAGRPVAFSREDVILGTAGAIRRVRELGLLGDEPFVVANGDVFTTLPLAPLRKALDASPDVLAALAVLPNERPDVDTPLWSDGGGRLIGVGARPVGPDVTGPWLFTGLQAARPALVDRIPPGVSELARDVLIPSAKERDGAFALVPQRTDSFWFDLGTPERLARAECAVRGHQESPRGGVRGTRRSGSPRTCL